ncbi:hypothetical protein LAUMK40_05826 [Mycobacterium kansasii]|nr:hypothetical protein LAUMK40_05826 [Mycobacterium kansasii]
MLALRCRRYDLGGAEVGEDDPFPPIRAPTQQDVGRLDVLMDDPAPVGVVEYLGHLVDHP